MRIVSLNCSNTEIVCALGCADFLVGVDDHSDYPPDVVARLPRVGPDLGIDIDKVSSLNPDLVLASLTVPGHEEIVAGLEQAGLPYVAPEPVSLADIHHDIRTIAARIGVPQRGESVVREMCGDITGADLTGPRPSILVQWWPKPVIAPGRLSWVDDLLRAAGAANPLGDRDVKSSPLSDQQVCELDPDAMVIAWCGVKPEKYRPDVLYRNPAWQGLQVITKRRVFCVPEAHLGRPSPRVIDGYRALRAIAEQLTTDLE